MGAFNDGIRLGASAASDYEIEKSLRFEYGGTDTTGPYLTRTPASSGNLKTFTISVWIKKCTTPGAEGFADSQTIISNGGGGGSSYAGRLAFDTNDRLNWVQNNPAPTQHIQLQTSRKFRDCSSWYHIVLIQDTTQAASADRARLYVNGVKETVFDATTYPTQDYDGYFNNNTAHNIGSNAVWGSLSTRYGHFNGYIAEFHFLDGTVKEPSNFGKTNVSTGQWIPTEYTGGSYGTNGFYLQFLDNSGTTATTLGKDTSGQTNNWTPSGFSVTAGKDDDSMLDTPTNNFPTLNPGDKSLVGTVSYANLRVSYNYKPASKTFRSTMALPASGKFYWEWENEEASSNPGRWNTGLVRYTNEEGVLDHQGYNDVDYVSISYGGSIWFGTTNTSAPGAGWSSWPSFYSGERVAIAIDCSNGKVWMGKVASGGGTTWYAADSGTDGNPAAGTNETGTVPTWGTGSWMPYIGWHDGGGAVTATFTSNINFGQHSFLGTPPTGFETLSSANLPTPTIKDGRKHFNTITYTGTITDTSTQTVSGAGFQPDLTWIKRRDGANSPQLVDDVRGVGKWLESSGTAAEQTSNTNGVLTTFNADGFVLTGGSTNANLCCESGYTYAAWNWKESASAGFDILTWTGDGSNRTIAHNLGVAPQMVIVKRRDDSAHWAVWHKNLADGTKWLALNLTNAEDTESTLWNSAVPTSSVINIGTNTTVNASSGTYVGYVFAGIEGYSKCGKYTGNGNADGTYVHTGFKTAYVMTKRAVGGSGNWNIFDKKRPGYNVTNDRLFSNITNAEIDGSPTDNQVDLFSNGFKMRGSNVDTNGSGSTYVYIAFAETSLKYANAR